MSWSTPWPGPRTPTSSPRATARDSGTVSSAAACGSSPFRTTDQARIAARTLCGKPTERFTAPWFWSDQYDHRLQMAGLPQAGDTAVVRGDPSSHSFTVVYLRDGVITGLHAVNRPRDFAAGRQLVAARAAMARGEAVSEDVPLSESMKQHQSTVERRA
nr:oxidoreductase C-terminal domain-containing protein [Streptomyces sporangiiformans]